MSTKPTKLFDFPCLYADWVDRKPTSNCWHERRGHCECSEQCPMLPIYRQAIADHRCARLLAIFERRWGLVVQWRLRGRLDKVRRFRRWIRDALRSAGLLETEEG